jgi:arylsulfatase A-like enzyme
LDDADYLEANGKTVLDNTLVVVGTDYGGGGNSTGHIPEGVFHAVAGGNGHFRPGFYDTEYNIIDLYETVLRPYGINSGMGAGNHPTFRYTPQLIDELLA